MRTATQPRKYSDYARQTPRPVQPAHAPEPARPQLPPGPEAAGRVPLRERLRSPVMLFTFASILALYLGWRVIPLQRYITPERGTGYVLGIIGGSLMLLLLLYPLRKRVRLLSFMGSVKTWFRLHMIMGIVGPILVLYHSNFSLGAANSNVALICMLLVAGSGVIGRYLYTKIHEELHGHETTLTDLQARAARLRQVSFTVPFMAELLQKLEDEESRLLSRTANRLLVLRPAAAAVFSKSARWRLSWFVRKATRRADKRARLRLREIARTYIETRIVATRRVADYQAYAGLFSWWHVLHLPLFLLQIVAAVVHIIAVHVY